MRFLPKTCYVDRKLGVVVGDDALQIEYIKHNAKNELASVRRNRNRNRNGGGAKTNRNRGRNSNRGRNRNTGKNRNAVPVILRRR